jgi:peptide deformylase
MALRKIVSYPERVLLQPGEPVADFDADLEELAKDMFETMYAAQGVGLAAPQIGLSLRFFVMDCDRIKLAAANPEIISRDGEQADEEGCLSVGSIHAPLKRAERVVLRAQDLNGDWYEREATGLTARCFLHETDHCDGILFINRLSPLKRDLVKRKFRKLSSGK